MSINVLKLPIDAKYKNGSNKILFIKYMNNINISLTFTLVENI